MSNLPQQEEQKQETIIPKKENKKKEQKERKRVTKACIHCQKSHMSCDSGFSL